MGIRAILFDLDGTLVDTNDAHVEAWLTVFKQFQYRVGRRRVEVEIGKGGDLLVPSILGNDVDEGEGDAMREARVKLYKERLERTGVRFFDGAFALFDEVRRRGLRTAIATSSSPEDIELIERLTGCKLAAVADVITSKEDAAVSKPAPDILHAACRKLGEDPLACMMLGDSLHDAAAACNAGTAFAGVITGFVDEPQFIEAGARFIAKDLRHLGAALGDALSAASLSRVTFDDTTLEAMMNDALGAARDGLARREVPIGAALLDRDGRLLATGHNRQNETGDFTAHAEMDALRYIAGRGLDLARGGTLVSTLEPCVMCLGAAIEVGIDVVVYGLDAPANGGRARVSPPRLAGQRFPRIRGGLAASESRALFKTWLGEIGTEPQRAPVEQLLAETAQTQ